jgi:hypothetical protein
MSVCVCVLHIKTALKSNLEEVNNERVKYHKSIVKYILQHISDTLSMV